MTISIKPTATIEDYQAIEWLQAEIWGSVEDVTPTHMLLTIAKEGGVVLLARENDKPVGFAYAFPALTGEGNLKLASHQAGVLPAYQDIGLGHKLKLAQYDAAMDKGFNLVTWTFDPLLGRNARLNLRKLGAVCNTYIPNLYGDMADELNQGLPSDRFRVDWWVRSKYVTRRLAGEAEALDSVEPGPVLNPAGISNGLLIPTKKFIPATTESCLVEIPTDINVLKERVPDLALEWRMQTRRIFSEAFETGYTTIDLLRREGRNYYLLLKDWQPD